MIPKIIHQTSKKPTPEEDRLSLRMRRILPGWEYRFWTDAENESLVAERFPEYLSTFRGIRRGVIKADIARYMYLSAFGGFYFDTDYKVLRAIDEETLSHSCVLPISRSGRSSFRLGNAAMGSKAGHPFWTDFIGHIFSTVGLTDLPESEIENVTGPDGLTKFYVARKKMYGDIYLPDKPIFHPVHTCGGFLYQREPVTVGVHLSWGSWRTKNLLKAMVRFTRRKVTSFF
jgi:mannosyltransferase OCH1-like enzyme